MNVYFVYLVAGKNDFWLAYNQSFELPSTCPGRVKARTKRLNRITHGNNVVK